MQTIPGIRFCRLGRLACALAVLAAVGLPGGGSAQEAPREPQGAAVPAAAPAEPGLSADEQSPEPVNQEADRAEASPSSSPVAGPHTLQVERHLRHTLREMIAALESLPSRTVGTGYGFLAHQSFDSRLSEAPPVPTFALGTSGAQYQTLVPGPGEQYELLAGFDGPLPIGMMTAFGYHQQWRYESSATWENRDVLDVLYALEVASDTLLGIGYRREQYSSWGVNHLRLAGNVPLGPYFRLGAVHSLEATSNSGDAVAPANTEVGLGLFGSHGGLEINLFRREEGGYLNPPATGRVLEFEVRYRELSLDGRYREETVQQDEPRRSAYLGGHLGNDLIRLDGLLESIEVYPRAYLYRRTAGLTLYLEQGEIGISLSEEYAGDRTFASTVQLNLRVFL